MPVCTYVPPASECEYVRQHSKTILKVNPGTFVLLLEIKKNRSKLVFVRETLPKGLTVEEV
jgi:hypothetical protein